MKFTFSFLERRLFENFTFNKQPLMPTEPSLNFFFFNFLVILQETKNQATLHLDSLYNEIRPAIEEHERDSQDSVPTSVAERWIEASCSKLKAEFDLYASIIKNISCTPRRPRDDVMFNGDSTGDGIKYLENGR